MIDIKNITCRNDLRALGLEKLPEAARQIRQLIKESVCKNGGHLASNLGVTELTLALHYVFDFHDDRIVWDVGHQCYVHKMLTGRAGQFDMLRQAGGISGFPDPRESDSDQFAVGHAGTAVATAVGLALGEQYQGSSRKIVAVVGDGSIVNGLSFEGLNNTNLVNRQLLIILNDNSMAIDKTEGAFAKYLAQLRLSRSYEDLHRRTKLLVKQVPYLGSSLDKTLGKIKGGLKSTLLHRQIFEQLGIPYFGPVDGHDLPALIQLLEGLKNADHPVLLHVQTEKGRGVSFAHDDPTTFHSPSPFKLNGEKPHFAHSAQKTFTQVFAEALSAIMAEDDKVIALTAAMPDGTGLAKVREKFPARVIDVGIAESAAVDIAAGLAKTGLKPVAAIYSTFLQRSFDQIFQEISLQRLPVVLAVDRAGLVGSDGAVHHGFCDIALLRTLPGLTLVAPMNAEELNAALRWALNSGQACAIRYPRDAVGDTGALLPDYTCAAFALGKAQRLSAGQDAALIGFGTTALLGLEAAEMLAGQGIKATVVSARFAKPLDENLLAALLQEFAAKPVVFLEDHALAGGFASAVWEMAQRRHLDIRHCRALGLPDKYIDYNSRKGQMVEIGMTASAIAALVHEMRCR